MKQKKQEVLGIDIGGTHMRFGLVCNSCDLRCFESISTREVFQPEHDPIVCLTECIQNYCDKNMPECLPAAVSIGFPSTISKDRTVAMQTPNIPCIPNDFSVVKELQARLHIPVFINRDVNYLLLFDQQDLALQDKDCVVAVYFGTGIGNAILLNGKLLLGRNGVAAELGHVPVYGNDRICGCGNKGCIETLVSGIAMEKLQEQNFANTHISQLFALHRKSLPMRQFVEGMAEAVATEINLFDPDCVVLGGGLLQMEGFPYNTLELAIHEHTRKPYPEKNLEIRYSRPNQKNGVIGAGIYAHKRLADASYL